MNRETATLAQAVLSSVHSALMSAYANRHDPDAVRRFERQADFLESKFKSEFKYHPLTYIEIYENYERACKEQGLHPD